MPYRSHWSDRSKSQAVRRFAERFPTLAKKYGTAQRIKDKPGLIREAEALLTNISYWASMGCRVIVSRDTGFSSWHRLRALDTLAKAGLIRQYIAPRHSAGGISTEIEATEQLLKEIGSIKTADILSKRTVVIELRNKAGEPLPLPKQLLRLSPAVKRLNRVLRGTVIELDGKREPAPQYYRVFNQDETGGGRWYHEYQDWSKEDRQRMTIDGQSVTELDFSALHPRLIYASHGIQYDADPYTIEGVPRDDAKLVFLQLLYDTSIASARHHLKIRQRPDMVRAYHQHRDGYKKWFRDNPEQRGEPPRRPRKLWEGFKPLDASIDVDATIDAFLNHHPAIAEDFQKPGQALRIQYRDALIAERVFAKHVELKRPVLGVHDSFIVQSKYAEDLRQIMADSYAEISGGFRCSVK